MKDIDRDYWMPIEDVDKHSVPGTVANSMKNIMF
jgi:hypothetical protein